MNLLTHVAIIMDGNGRWGLINKNSRNAGHKQGLLSVENIIAESIKQNIKFLTLFAFSTENWKRPQKEINYLFRLLENFLVNKIDQLHAQNIKLKIIGKKKFSKKLNNLLVSAEKKTSRNNKIQLNIALNYGSKSELVYAVRQIIKKKQSITEKNIDRNLFTKDIPNPDLLIRTGSTKRLSNFLLWQLSYSEIVFIKKLWPDFKILDYRKVIKQYQMIKRNYGAL